MSGELKKLENDAVYISGSQTGMLVPLATPEVVRGVIKRSNQFVLSNSPEMAHFLPDLIISSLSNWQNY
jgi:hypothetical protein